MSLLKRIYDTKYLLHPSKRLGELPSSREAYHDVIRMAWPAIVESMLAMLTSLLDTLMIGTCGTVAIAAIGTSGSIRNLVLLAFIALNGATSAIVARRIGEGNNDGANNTLNHGVVLSIVISFVVIIPSSFFSRELIELSGARPEHFPEATNYFNIWFAGIPMWALSTVINSALRGAGNMRATMVSTTTAQIVNVVLNYVLINGKLGFPALGVSGASLATALSFAAQAAVSLIIVMDKRNKLHLTLNRNFRPDAQILSPIGKISSASILQSLFFTISSVFFARIINSLGSASMFASWQIANTLYGILIAVADGLMVAIATLTGQNLGKGRPDLVILDMKICLRFAVCSAALFFFIFFFFGESIASLYVHDRASDAETIKNITHLLKVIGIFTLLHTAIYIYLGVLSGAGDARFVGVVSIICTGIIRTLAAFIFTRIPELGIVGAWLGVIVDELIRTSFYIVRIKRGKWANIKV